METAPARMDRHRQRYLRSIDDHASKTPRLDGQWAERAAESSHYGRVRLDGVIQPLETARGRPSGAVPLAMQSP